jgi:hypothetical protein
MKPKEGFLSDNLYYLPNPFVAPKGTVSQSKPLQTDGSTDPISVKLLSIRNKATGKEATELLKEKEIQVFTGTVEYTDNSVELLNKKLSKKMVRPLNIAPIGGRIEISQASEYIDTGTYVIDIEVSNVRGKKILNNIEEIRIVEKKHYDLISSAATNSVPGNETVFTNVPGGFPVTVTHIPNGPDKIILKIVDKNGTPFNPKAGQIIPRGDRPQFADLDPYFVEEKTDTALVFQYPAVPFPLFTNAGKYGSSYNNYLNYYRVPSTANSADLNYNPTVAFRVYSKGTWIITGKILTATKL